MSSLYKKLSGFGAVVAILAILILGSAAQQAGATVVNCPTGGTALKGWAWSSNIGWISFNSQNAGSGGHTHCVNKTSTGDLVGWAWSSNIGWIKFGELSGFPTTSGAAAGVNAKIVGDQVTGWARACAGTVKSGDSVTAPIEVGDCSTMTSRPDGWDGWIELSGSKHLISYNPSSGAITGYAWGSDVVGWVSMYNLFATTDCGGATCTPSPSPSASASCSLTSEQLGSSNQYRLRWNTNPPAVNVTSCTGVNFSTDDNLIGSTIVTPAAGGTTYTLMCTTSQNTQITCNSPRSLGGGGGGGGGDNPGIDQCPGCVAPGGATLSLTVIDSRYGSVTNTSDTGILKTARVQKGKPFGLFGGADLSQFEDGEVTISADDTAVVINKKKVNETQSITQNKQVVLYKIEGIKKGGLGQVISTSIQVQVVDPNLTEI